MTTLKPLSVDSSSFDRVVLGSATPVLVDFSADWCPPCRMLKPVLEEIAGALAGRVSVAVVDVDQGADLASTFGVQSIPALKLFVGGTVVAESAGFKDRDALLAWIDASLSVAT